MGASLVYLDKPNKDIEFETGSNGQLEFVAAGMQGWRLNMEDAHIAELNLETSKRMALFGVFDGHGGREVSSYCKSHFLDIVRKDTNFKKEHFEDCLR